MIKDNLKFDEMSQEELEAYAKENNVSIEEIQQQQQQQEDDLDDNPVDNVSLDTQEPVVETEVLEEDYLDNQEPIEETEYSENEEDSSSSMDSTAAKSLFETASANYDLGDYDSYLESLGDKNNRLSLYNSLKEDFDLGDYSDFENVLFPSPDEDFNPDDPTSFDENGHRVLDSKNEELANSLFDNLDDYDGLIKSSDAKYLETFKNEGEEAAEDYYSNKKKTEFASDYRLDVKSFNYWLGHITNKAKSKGYLPEGQAPLVGVKDYINDENADWSQVLYKDNPSMLKEANLVVESNRIKEDIDIYNSLKQRRDKEDASKEDKTLYDDEYENQTAIFERELKENQKKIADLRYERYKESGGQLPLYKEALDNGVVDSSLLVNAIKLIDGEVPDAIIESIASNESVSIDEDDMSSYELEMLSAERMRVSTETIAKAALNLGEENSYPTDLIATLRSRGLVDENGEVDFADWLNDEDLKEVFNLLEDSTMETEEAYEKMGSDLDTSHLDAYNYLQKAYIKSTMEQSAFVTPDEERREAATEALNEITYYEERLYPEGLNNKERFNLLWHTKMAQVQDYAERNFDDPTDIYLQTVKLNFLGDTDEGANMKKTMRILNQYSDLALLNYNSLDVGPDSALEYVTDFVTNTAKNTAKFVVPMSSTFIGTGYQDAREIGSLAQQANVLDKNALSDDFKEEMSAVYDFEKAEFKTAGLGDGEFWEDAVGNSLGIMIDIVAGGKGSKAILKSGKVGKNLLRVANIEKKAMKRLMKSPAYINKVASKKWITRGFSSARTQRNLAKMVETGLTYQVGGMIFPKDMDELNFGTGMFGFFGEKLLGKIVPRMDAIGQVVNKMFGNKADDAFKLIASQGDRLRRMGGRGIGEVGEENAQQVAQMWQNQSTDFWEEFTSFYGNADNVLKLTVSSFVLGASFGIADSGASANYSSNVNKLKKQLSPTQLVILEKFIGDYNNNMASAMENSLADLNSEKTGEREFTGEELMSSRYSNSDKKVKDLMTFVEDLSEEQVSEFSKEVGIEFTKESLLTDEKSRQERIGKRNEAQKKLFPDTRTDGLSGEEVVLYDITTSKSGKPTGTWINPKTGDIDVVITGSQTKSGKSTDMVSFKRLYDKKGKATNQFTSKFQIQTKKADFKKMITEAQNKLPSDHQWVENKSISIDGLSVFNKALGFGYTTLKDSNGKVVTRKTLLNDATKTKVKQKGEEAFGNTVAVTPSEVAKVKSKVEKAFPGAKVNALGMKKGGKIEIELPVLVLSEQAKKKAESSSKTISQVLSDYESYQGDFDDDIDVQTDAEAEAFYQKRRAFSKAFGKLTKKSGKLKKDVKSIFKYAEDGRYSFEGIPKADAEIVAAINKGDFEFESLLEDMQRNDSESSEVEASTSLSNSAADFVAERVIATAATVKVSEKNVLKFIEENISGDTKKNQFANAFAAANTIRITNEVIEGGKPPATHSSSPEAQAEAESQGIPILSTANGVNLLIDFLENGVVDHSRSGKWHDKVLTKVFWVDGIKKMLTNRGLAPEFINQLGQKKVNSVKNTMNQVNGIHKNFEKALKVAYGSEPTSEQLEAVNSALRGDPAALKSITDQGVLDSIQKMRKTIDNLSNELISIGAVSGSMKGVIQKNLGIYLNTRYAVHMNSNWASAVDQVVYNDAVKHIAETSKISEDDAKGIVDKLIMDPSSNSVIMTKKSFGSVDTSVFKKTLKSKKAAKVVKALNKKREIAINNGDAEAVNRLTKEMEAVDEADFEIAPEIKALLGEIKDPSFNFLNTTSRLVDLVENHKMLETLRDAGIKQGIFSTESKGATTVEVPSSSSYANNPLGRGQNINEESGKREGVFKNKLYTTPEMAMVLSEYYKVQDMEKGNMRSGLLDAFIKINSIAKMSKTVYSTGSMVANLTSASLVSVYNGNFLRMFSAGHSGEASVSLVDFMRIATKGGSYENAGVSPETNHAAFLYEKFLQNGVIDQSVELKEMQSAFKELAISQNGETLIQKVADSVGLKSTVKKVGNIFGKVKKAHQWVYAMGDDFPKFMMAVSEITSYTNADPAFQELIKKNNGDATKAWGEFVKTDNYSMIVDQASQISKNVVPTYSMLPGVVSSLKKIPLFGTFVAFPAESIRCAINIPLQAFAELRSKNKGIQKIGARRMSGFMIANAAFASIGAISRNMIGVDDEEEKAHREVVAPWSKYTNWIWLGKPKGGKVGDMSYIDLSRYDSFGFGKEIISALYNGGFSEGVKTGTAPFLDNSFATQLALGYFGMPDPKTGKLVVSPEDDFVGKSKDLSYFAYKLILENGWLRGARQLDKAMSDDQEENKYGNKPTINDALGSLYGAKSYTSSPSSAMFFRTRDWKKQIDNTKSLYYQRDRSIEQVNERLKENQEEFYKMYKAVLKTGVPVEDIHRMFKESNLSNKTIYHLMNNEIEEFIPKISR